MSILTELESGPLESGHRETAVGETFIIVQTYSGMRCVATIANDTRPEAVTMIECNNCSQFSDWPAKESNWELVNEENPVAVHPLLQCRQCGHHQPLQ